MRPFRRRVYQGPRAFFGDVRYMLTHRPLLREAMRGDLVSLAFRERLMLTVTEVNGCRYCSYYHSRESLKAGITEAEVKDLLGGIISSDSPEEEYVALLYAQHWAETNGHPDPETLEKLIETYGGKRADAIEVILRMIRTGNPMGNTWDFILYWLSRGRLGMTASERKVAGKNAPA